MRSSFFKVQNEIIAQTLKCVSVGCVERRRVMKCMQKAYNIYNGDCNYYRIGPRNERMTMSLVIHVLHLFLTHKSIRSNYPSSL